MNIWKRKKPSFGFISTRFAGLDGVSLETQKWADVITSKGCSVYYMAGELDTDPEISHLVPEAHFQHEAIFELHNAVFVDKFRSPEINRKIFELTEELKKALYQFHSKFDFEILVVENALSIPVNIPLGLAITHFIIETGIPTIAHHHDFFWERERFKSEAATDYLRAAFPPVHSSIQHVVINSISGHDFGKLTGSPWILIPNVLDFKTMPPEIDEFNIHFRKDLNIEENTRIVFQPTRIVSRKGIEIAAELAKKLEPPKSTFVISHKADDEGYEYLMRIEEFAKFIGVDIRIISDHIGPERKTDENGNRIFTLWDAYLHADIVTYPSLYEGYGNAFVETIYMKKPIVINRYPIFIADIEPKGFDAISFDTYITPSIIQETKTLLNDPARLAEMAENNYLLGWRYLSYELLEEKLEQLLINIYGA